VQKTLNSTLSSHQDLYCQQIYDCFREHVLRQRLHSQRQALESLSTQAAPTHQSDFKDGNRPSPLKTPQSPNAQALLLQTASKSGAGAAVGNLITDE
jgi:hypothetical protein